LQHTGEAMFATRSDRSADGIFTNDMNLHGHGRNLQSGSSHRDSKILVQLCEQASTV
jgi:hypothetical protein